MGPALPSLLLAVQHHRIDQCIGRCADGAGEPEALAASLRLLREHLYVEEEALFPPLARTGVAMAIFVMKREHGQMWPLIRSLEAACVAGTSGEDLREDAKKLLEQLKIHNPTEEQTIYEAADRYESTHPGASLVEAMAAARMPEDWVCEKARRADAVPAGVAEATGPRE